MAWWQGVRALFVSLSSNPWVTEEQGDRLDPEKDAATVAMTLVSRLLNGGGGSCALDELGLL